MSSSINGPRGGERREPLARRLARAGGRRAGRVRGEPGDPLGASASSPPAASASAVSISADADSAAAGPVHLGAQGRARPAPRRPARPRARPAGRPPARKSSSERGDAAVDADGHDERGSRSGARGERRGSGDGSSATSSTSPLGQRAAAIRDPRSRPRAPDCRPRRVRRAGSSASDAHDCEIGPGRGTRGLGDRLQRVRPHPRRRAGPPRGERCQCGRASVRSRGETPLFGESMAYELQWGDGRARPAARGRAPRRRRSIPTRSTARTTSTAPTALREDRAPARDPDGARPLLGLSRAPPARLSRPRRHGLGRDHEALRSLAALVTRLARCRFPLELLPGVRCRTSGTAEAREQMLIP